MHIPKHSQKKWFISHCIQGLVSVRTWPLKKIMECHCSLTAAEGELEKLSFRGTRLPLCQSFASWWRNNYIPHLYWYWSIWKSYLHPSLSLLGGEVTACCFCYNIKEQQCQAHEVKSLSPLQVHRLLQCILQGAAWKVQSLQNGPGAHGSYQWTHIYAYFAGPGLASYLPLRTIHNIGFKL